jgi:hypothetical protein
LGTSGNIAWAEGGLADLSEPAEALKLVGYGLDEIPTHEEWNWLLYSLGRASIRRFATAEDLIHARRAADVATPEDFGIVLPAAGSGGTSKKWSVVWEVAGDANEVDLVADGEYLWTIAGAGAARFVRRRSRITGAVDLDEPAPVGLAYPGIACAGGNVYALDLHLGNLQVVAYDRSTLAQLYTVDTATATPTATAIATDGRYVAVVADNLLYLYQDTGAALTLVGAAYDHTAQINDVAMDGSRIILGGATPGAADQIRVLSYTPAISSTLDRAGNSQVLRVDTDGGQVAYVGDTDGGDYTGWFRSEDAAQVVVKPPANDVQWLDGLLVFARGGSVSVWDPLTASLAQVILWDAGAATAVNRLAYDYDGLFALGAATAGGFRLRRYCCNEGPRLYHVLSPQTPELQRHGGVHSLLRPVR